MESTRPGELKGKIAYMSPEHVTGAEMDRRADLFSAGAMFWSALTARRLFRGKTDAETFANIIQLDIPPASSIGLKPPEELDAVADMALQRDPEERFQTALAMEEALREAAESISCIGSKREVAAWVKEGFGDDLAERRRLIKEARNISRVTDETIPSLGTASSPGSTTPSDSQETPVTTAPSFIGDSSREVTLPTAVLPPSQRLQQSSRSMLLAVSGAGVALVILAGTLYNCEQETTDVAASAAAATSTMVTTTVSASQPEVLAQPSVSTSSEAPEAAESASSTATAAAPRRVVPVRRRRPPPAAPPPTATPAPKPPPAQPAAPKSPQPWDRDSPLPPP
jgi:serine/threonine-protein kinase